LEKIKPYIENITGDYQKGFGVGRSLINNIFALKIINKKNGNVIRLYNIYWLIFKRHMTLLVYIERRYGNVWNN
jgi:hypothetical protein